VLENENRKAKLHNLSLAERDFAVTEVLVEKRGNCFERQKAP
jgi:hypothetical protein